MNTTAKTRHPVLSACSAIRESIAAHGWIDGTIYVLARALTRVSRGRWRLFKYHFVAQPVPERAEAAAPRPTSIKLYRVCGTEDIVSRFPRPAEIIAWRFADGSACFVAERGGILVGFIWIKLHRYQEDEVRCDYLLDSGVGWDFDAWVAPEFRMTRAFVQLWEAANEYLRQHGCRWSASRISAFNPASLAAHRRLGARHLDTGVFVALGSVQVALFSCPPYAHLGFGPGSRPQLRFRPPDPSEDAQDAPMKAPQSEPRR